jgi:hypothetical protein
VRAAVGKAVLVVGVILFLYAGWQYATERAPACTGTVYGNYCGLRGLDALLPAAIALVLIIIGGIIVARTRG